MKTRYLLPHPFQLVGVIVLAFAIICIFIINAITPAQNMPALSDIAKTISPYSGCFPAIFIGLLFIGFSKEKIEDEHIVKLRLESLQWAIITNYTILFYCFFFVSGTSMIALIMLNLLTPIVFFIVRFRWKIRQLNRLSETEEVAS